ncbi:MAG: hypothetical protein HQ541_22315 [Mariniphaga sp.]|nr:hypothetical protein [Mariniphaga sp.]
MLQQNTFSITDLSNHLFWDVDPNILDMEKNFCFILSRILEYGLLNDWILLFKQFGLEKITLEAKKIRSLDEKSLHFIAQLSDSKLEEFRCYTYKQSTPKHWNF